MTQVRIRRTADGSISGFTIKGHAGFDDVGRDIVCAGVTAVAETAILGLQQVAQHPCRVRRRSGFLECLLEGGSETARERARSILETMVVGLKDIEKDYPGFVRVTEGG